MPVSAEGVTIDALLAGAPPDADAIVSPAHPTLTYRELRCRVAAIGAVLRDQGTGAQDGVAVVAEDARQLAVSFSASSPMRSARLSIRP